MADAKLKVAASNEIKIDKGVPFAGRGSVTGKYPWAEMEAGDSFLAPNLNPTNAHNVARTASRNGKVFVARKTAAGYRIWRTE